MSNIYTDPPQSRNEAIIKSTIDGTQYTDPPQSRMEDLLLELKEAIEGGGGGGTTVVANPEGEATDELEKLQVGSDIYGIPKDYAELDNKPQINSVTLSGNKTASELGLQPTLDGTKTVSGNPITVTDAEPMNAESVKVELEPKQDLHGYDAPWVGGAGKNLLPIINTTRNVSGVDYAVNPNGTITTDGTATALSYFVLTNDTNNLNALSNIVIPKGTTIIASSGVSNDTLRARYTNATYFVLPNDTLFTLEEDVALVYISVSSGETIDEVVYSPMIRLATETDPTFAPYSNICPISGYSEVNVERVGKNLFDESEVVQGSKAEPSNGTRCCTRGYFGLYLHAGDVVTYSSNSYDVNCSFEIIDEDYNSHQDSGWITENTTITITTSGYAFFGFKKANNSNIQPSDIQALNIQLELGNQATTYEPYQGNTYTIDLGGTKYGGTLDVTEGGYSDEWGYIEGDSVSDLVSAGMSGTTTIGGLYALALGGSAISQDDDEVATIDNLVCNNLENITATQSWGINISGVAISYLGNVIFVVKDITTQADMDTWLSNNPIQIAYRKKTPTSVSTTPTDIELLENTNNISTDGTNITLKYQPNNVIGECKAYTDEQCAKVLPPLPTTDGTYHLSCEVTSGVGVLSWASDS